MPMYKNSFRCVIYLSEILRDRGKEDILSLERNFSGFTWIFVYWSYIKMMENIFTRIVERKQFNWLAGFVKFHVRNL